MSRFLQMTAMTFRRPFTGVAGTAIILAFSCLIAPAIAAAGVFSFAGNFHQDDETRTFSVTVLKSANVIIRTYSYSGGANSGGALVPPGGFDTSLSVFDGSGALIVVNRDGGCDNVAADPVTRLCWDSLLTFAASPGNYRVVLTESENTPRGPTLKEGFVYDTAGNFTADPEAGASDGFWDLSLHHRTSAYALDISGADTAQLGLTSAVSALTNGASAGAGQIAPNDILSYYDPGLTGEKVTVTLNGQPLTVLYSGPGQINFLLPGDIPPGQLATLQISRGQFVLLSSAFNTVAADPALFTNNSQGTGQGAILNQDYSLNGPTLPAKRGAYIILYGTGFGAVLPPGADGLSLLAAGVTAKIGGVLADVTYAGLVPGETSGLQQINVHLPDDTPVGPTVPVQLTVGGVATQAGVTAAIAQ
jgi:uncharacterized protein (TIGR03437 family)